MAAGLDEIARAEPSFDAGTFLEGAKAAYEAIVMSFAHGDRRALKDLLRKDVYDGFEKAIVDRERRGEKVETTFVSIDKAEIAESQKAFAARAVKWDLDTNVSRRMAYNHYFNKPAAKKS